MSNNDLVGVDGSDFVDYIKIYHVHKDIVNEFKEFCKKYAHNRFDIGIKLLLDSFREKESYLYVMSVINNLIKDVEMLKNDVYKESDDQNNDSKIIKYIGGKLEL